jgi:transcriptional regulator GlxA family with amidase domain
MSAAERHVVLVGFEGVQLLDLAGPADVFDAASRVIEAAGGEPAYRLTIATAGAAAVRASSGMKIESDADVGAIDPDGIDTLLVAGGPGRRVLEDSDGSPIRPLVDLIVAEPGGDHRVPVLAEQAALSERQLTRLFAKETRTTPARFVERVRVEAARDLLEAGRSSVDAVAEACGFGSAETMRRAFRRVLGIGPGEYRQRFGAGTEAQGVEAV